MVTKTFRTTVVRNGSVCFIPVTFDPKVVFGKVRAPVKVTLNGYTYRSTIAAMAGRRASLCAAATARLPV